MSHPGSQGCDIDLSSANVIEILLAYRAFRQTLNVSYSNDTIVRKIRQLEKEFSCTLMRAQITDIFYANFIQWAHEGGNCYSTIKLYCNQLKAALVWASRHGCLLSRTYNDFEVPRYFKSRVALTPEEICHVAHFDISKLERRPQYRQTLEKYNYRSPYTGTVSNYNRYLHELLNLIGEEFNDIVITEVRSGGIICRNEQRKWELCTSHTGRRTFISYNVMRCQTEAEVRKCSGHKSMKPFERYITFDED